MRPGAPDARVPAAVRPDARSCRLGGPGRRRERLVALANGARPRPFRSSHAGQTAVPSDAMIESAEEYIWANARVLEQRRFELLFKGGDPQPVIDAVKPYKTPDGGYGYALEPDGRGPTSQPPHIWTALEALEDAGTTDADVCDHLTTHDDAGRRRPRRSPLLEPFPHAPWWRIGTEGSLLATSLLYAPLARHGVDHPWLERRSRSAGPQIDAIEKTHPYEVEAAITFLDAARDRGRAEQAAERLGTLVREQNLVGTQPEGYTEARSTTRTTSRAAPTASRARGSPTRTWTAASTTSPPSSTRTAAGGSRGPYGCPRSSSSGAGS